MRVSGHFFFTDLKKKKKNTNPTFNNPKKSSAH